MGRKFNTRKKNISAPINKVYLKNPVGSNEWHKEKKLQMYIRSKKNEEEKKTKVAVVGK